MRALNSGELDGLGRTNRSAIELGDPTGNVTFDQLDNLLRSDLSDLAPEDIEALFLALSAKNIQVVEELRPSFGGALQLLRLVLAQRLAFTD